jgi:aryl-alcohol dehydrogenase-like predicted oxidoreductase
MNRRAFLGAVALAATTAPLLAAGPLPKHGKLPTRKLGRTGITVPILGFGSGSRFLMYKNEDEALAALSGAIDLGIFYIDTAHDYGKGQSEERIGRLMGQRRKDVVLATKISARTAEQAKREIELSLKRLQTDHLDVLHIHALKDQADLAKVEAKGGVLEALYDAREKRVARAIGITCHAAPAALRDALERHDFDCAQMALNAGLAYMADAPGGMKATLGGANSFEQLALPVANRKRMGVVAMKVFGQEQLLGAAPAPQLLAYALSLPVSLASVGMPRPEFIQSNASLAASFKPLNAKARRRLAESIESSRKLAMAEFFQDHLDA